MQLLVKGKARVEKSGENEVGLDDDSTALATAAAGIKMLCYRGRRKDVERSCEITKIVEDWIQKLHTKAKSEPVTSADDLPDDLRDQPRVAKPPVSGKALALAFHALGISQSCWARLTHETTSRSDLQGKALANFRNALEPDLGEDSNIKILYSLAFLLAETRETDSAIAVIKQALSSETTGSNTKDILDEGSVTQPDERGILLRCWHLLAILLSVREDFSTAKASCEAAFDLYGSKSILYGDVKHLDTISLPMSERKNIIELKVTHLALSEVTDGPEEAVNASGELLGLYTKMFKIDQKPAPKIQQPSQSPSSSVRGTLRSIRGSVLGLPKDPTQNSSKGDLEAQNSIGNALPPEKTPEDDSKPPSLPATGHNNSLLHSTNRHSHPVARKESKKLHKKHSRKSMSSYKTSRAPSPSKRPSTSEDSHRHILNVDLPFRSRHADQSMTDGSTDSAHAETNQYAPDEVGVAISHDLPSIPSSPTATSDPPNPLHTIPSTTENMNRRNPNTNPVPPKPPPQQNINPPQTSHSLSPWGNSSRTTGRA